MLDPAHLGDLDAAAVGDLLLRQVEAFTRLPQVLAQIPHREDRAACRGKAPCKILQVQVAFE